MIEMHDIEKYHQSGPRKTYVLRYVHLNVAEGEFVSIMGPSGAGKSTLLHIMGMLDESTAGSYRFLGEEVGRMGEKERTEIHRRHIGFVFQAYHLIDEQTVYENLEMPLLYQKVEGAERKARVSELLDRFQMVAKKDLFPHQLSGGEQQRVGVARALIGQPTLILADEPTGNLNSKQGEEVMDMLRELNDEGTTIVQVTHSEKNAGYGSRVVHLLDGKIEQEGRY
ncbi:MAG: ABC transporter ATP-binding protein [Gemmatimonadetes bacterium]|nr:ABC transporter ATP-binding protein [Gemmatimonadota bacterium]MYK42384.1 ABC transporter ATP-binding protein [Gemmatimonadota bacterium]